MYADVAADPATYGPRAAALVAQARASGPVEALVVALRAHAEAERLAPRNAAAKALLDEAVRLAARHGLDRRLGELLVTRVAVQQELGHLTAAQHDADRAANLLPAAELAQLLFQQAALWQNTGRLADAATHYRRLLADPACPAVVRAKAGNNLAHLESELGHDAVALAVLEAAERIAVEAGATVVAYLAQTRAFVEVQSGRLAESLAHFEQAHRLFGAAGLPLGGHYLEYSDALAGLCLHPEALAAALRGVGELPEHEVSLMAAEGQLRVARLALRKGDGAAAGIAVEHASMLFRRQRRPGWAARTALVAHEVQALAGPPTGAELRTLRRRAGDLERAGLRSDAVQAHLLAGRLASSTGRRDAARRSLHAAVELSRGAPVLVRLSGRLAAALLAEVDSDPQAMSRACRAGLADLDRHRRALPSVELRVLASTHGVELGLLGLRALRPRAPGGATPARVFGWLERTRAAALAPVEAPLDDAAQRELTALRGLNAELSAVHDEGRPEPAALLARVAAAEEAVRRASWATPVQPGGRAPTPPSAAEVRTQLGDAILVEYGLLDGRLLAAVLSRRGTRLLDLGPGDGLAATVDSLAFALRRLARPTTVPAAGAAAQRSAQAGLSELRARLLAPLPLDPAGPLVVVPVGDLQRVPWAALHAGPTTVAPSAGLWLRTRAPRPGGGQVALVAGPGLPGAGQEVAALRLLHPAAVVLEPPASTCEATVAALQDAALVHFACHGRLRGDNPSFSSLLLTDGPLSVHELSTRSKAPDRVVLAACESGAQVGFPGGEALGFVSALLARGAAGVLASGVLVPDEQVLALMVGVHRALAGGATLTDALWSARQDLDVTEPAQLAAWCAFDAYGAA